MTFVSVRGPPERRGDGLRRQLKSGSRAAGGPRLVRGFAIWGGGWTYPRWARSHPGMAMCGELLEALPTLDRPPSARPLMDAAHPPDARPDLPIDGRPQGGRTGPSGLRDTPDREKPGRRGRRPRRDHLRRRGAAPARRRGDRGAGAEHLRLEFSACRRFRAQRLARPGQGARRPGVVHAKRGASSATIVRMRASVTAVAVVMDRSRGRAKTSARVGAGDSGRA